MTIYVEDLEEGQACPLAIEGDGDQRCPGTLEIVPAGDCCCHISPPCSSCAEAPLVCSACGWEAEDVE